MEDFDYLATDSHAAWLDARGDGRFERYERFYHSERAQKAGEFDLEKANEGYGEWASRHPARMLAVISGPWFGRVIVAFFAVYMGSRLVPALASKLPVVTGAMLAFAFVGLRVFHWRRRKRR